MGVCLRPIEHMRGARGGATGMLTRHWRTTTTRELVHPRHVLGHVDQRIGPALLQCEAGVRETDAGMSACTHLADGVWCIRRSPSRR
jgi:hypothetical protein